MGTTTGFSKVRPSLYDECNLPTMIEIGLTYLKLAAFPLIMPLEELELDLVTTGHFTK